MDNFGFFGNAKPQTPAEIEAERAKQGQLRKQQKEASNAFTSPSRLGRTLSRTPSNLSTASGGASVCRSVSPARRGRSPSSTRSRDEKKVFDDMADSTSVVVKPEATTSADEKPATATETLSAIAQALASPIIDQAPNNLKILTDAFTASTVTQRNQIASPSSTNLASPLKAIYNKSEVNEAMKLCDAAIANARDLVGAGQQIENVASDLTEATEQPTAPAVLAPTATPRSQPIPPIKSGSPSKAGLDLKNNDNGFHVIASLIVDRYNKDLASDDEKYHVVSTGERQLLDRTIQPQVRQSLVEAIRYRLASCPQDSEKSIHVLVRKCKALGLDRDGQDNILFAPAFATVVFNKREKPVVVQPEVKPELDAKKVEDKPRKNLEQPHNKVPSPTQALPVETTKRTAVAQPVNSAQAKAVPVQALQDVSPESLARQQILSELREASQLMSTSETPETAKFWRTHVLDLQERLRTLHGENVPVPDLPDFSGVQTVGGPSMAPTTTQIRQATPPSQVSMTPRSVASVSPSPPMGKSSTAQAAFASAASATTQFSAQPQLGQPRVPLSNLDPALADAPIMDVIAPADLHGGATFEVEIEGRSFLATVPSGGVREGETFCCYMRDLSGDGSVIPVGRWRDTFWDCFAHGICHPALLNSLFCPLIALGQVMSRMRLDFLGRESSGELPTSTFSMIIGIGVFWGMMNLSIFAAFNYKWSLNMEVSSADIAAIAFLNVSGIAYIILATSTTRARIREKYLIDGGDCVSAQDSVAATFCLPCTISQMARHTAAYAEYDGVCCNDTGVPDHVSLDARPSPKGSYLV